jgi:hypothetical protein
MATAKSPSTSSRASRYKTPQMTVNQFNQGLITFLEPQQIPRGAAADSLNWITQGSKIEIRHGYLLMGTRLTGVSRVNGIFTAHRWDGTEVLFRCRGLKLEYYNTSLSPSDWTEVGTNILANEDTAMAEYFSQAGAQLWISSPNGDLIKIMTANPGDYKSQYDATKNFKGYMKIGTNRMFIWNYLATKNTLQLSKIDTLNYTFVVESMGTGDGSTKIFSNTLASITGKRTALAVQVAGATSALQTITAITQAANAQITIASHGYSVGNILVIQGVVGMTQINNNIATVVSVVNSNNFTVNINSTGFGAYSSAGSAGLAELFSDNHNGSLSSPAGGTGTINYTTGAVSVTFNGAPVNTAVIAANYQYEDSTVGGIADFTFSSPTRKSGEGNFFIEAEGGSIMYPHNYNSVEYILHERNAWAVTISADDSSASNVIFRKNLYSQYWRASVATSDGIYYIDTTDKSKPFFAVLEYSPISAQVLPRDLSGEKLDLSNYVFDKAVFLQWERYIVCACRTSSSTVNNRIIVYNRILDCFDIVDFYASCMAVYSGTLVAGDSATANVFQLFSGFDDDTATPFAYWSGNIDNYGSTGMKKTKELWLEGEIDPNQSIQVYISVDRGPFVLVGTISGKGFYVDAGSPVQVGQKVVGQTQVGSGNGPITSNHYETNIDLKLDKFQNRQIKFLTTGIGYASVSMHTDFDIRQKQEKLPRKYRNNP